MRLPSTAALIDLWDAGCDRDPVDRARILLEAAFDGDGDPADLSIGMRDRLLLEWRSRVFGARVDAVESCPACGALLEFALDVDEVRVDPPRDAAERDGPLDIDVAGYRLALRLPTSRDLAAIRGCGDAGAARALLLERCLVTAHTSGRARAVDARELPPPVLRAIADALAEADPQADIELSLACAVCGHGWHAPFDVVGFLWADIERFAWRTLRDVHQLASAYAWSEAAILALSARRRRVYLDMARSG